MKNIKAQLQYWMDYTGTGDDYRKEHDMDCVLTGGNLYADTLISLWIPLRYVLDKENTEKWNKYLEYEKEQLRPANKNLKSYNVFMKDLQDNVEDFIPTKELRQKVETLFELGRKRGNVIILPYRRWNNQRGMAPYWEYMPHFLYDLLNTNNEVFLKVIQDWIVEQDLYMYFETGKDIVKENIRDLAGSGNVTMHRSANINVDVLLDNYIEILRERNSRYEN